MSNKVAIIEKYPSNYYYSSLFPFDTDVFSLVPIRQDKVLKRDIILDIDNIKATYDYIILIGSEACKFVADIRSITEYQGFLVEEKYLALMNPAAIKIRPSLKGSYDKAVTNIINIISGNSTKSISNSLTGITDTSVANKYLTNLLNLVDNKKLSEIAMDTETSSLYPRDGYVLGISIATSETEAVYIDTIAIDEENSFLLQEIIQKVTIIFHNAKFDMKMLEYHFGFTFTHWHDTMLEHFNLDENSLHGLKGLSIKYTDLGDYDIELQEYIVSFCKQHKILKKDFSYAFIPFDIICPYACIDAIATYRLHKIFYSHIVKNPKLLNVYNSLLKKGTEFLQKVENNGIPIDKEYIENARVEVDDKVKVLTKSLYEVEEVKEVEKEKGVIFNPNSTAHVGMLLFNMLGLPILKTTPKGAPSCDSEVLTTLAEMHPVANTINDIKKLKKIGSTYLDKMLSGLDTDNRLRTNFNLHITTSGRLSSSGKLNAQQLPRDDKTVKNGICARESFKIISQDLKTAEMYIASVLSGDKVLQQIFVDKEDYHGAMAVQKFNLNCKPNDVKDLYPKYRNEAKTISFEILYKLNYREPALENFIRLKEWLQEQEAFIKCNGFIYSFFGRKRRLKDAFSPNRQEAQHHVRSGINFLVQSVSSDVNLLAAIEMQEWIEANNCEKEMIIFALVHDSILAEVHDDYIDLYRKKLAELTQKDRGLSIPGCPIGLDIEIGQRYGSVKPI